MIDKNLLYELLKVPSPSGYELPIQKKVDGKDKCEIVEEELHCC